VPPDVPPVSYAYDCVWACAGGGGGGRRLINAVARTTPLPKWRRRSAAISRRESISAPGDQPGDEHLRTIHNHVDAKAVTAAAAAAVRKARALYSGTTSAAERARERPRF